MGRMGRMPAVSPTPVVFRVNENSRREIRRLPC